MTSVVDLSRRRSPRAAQPPATSALLGIHARSWLATSAASGPPVVLVHGLVVASRMVAPVAEQLARRRLVHAPDLPGFGLSERPPKARSVTELADLLAAWMHHAAPAGADVVGNSFGCQVALDLAVRRPELVHRLVLSGPTVDRHARSWPRQLIRWQKEQATQSWRLRRIQAGDYARAGIPRAIRTFRFALADRPEDKVTRLRQPLLVVWGTRDPIVSRDWAAELAAHAPDGELAVIPGARHAMAHDDPLPYARVIDRFLSRTRS